VSIPTSVCQDRGVNAFDVTPEQASRGRVVADGDLPMLAAQWLVEGYDSPLLRELAGLSSRHSTEARQMFEAVLAELGHSVTTIDNPADGLPWLGYWEPIWWAVDQMDKTSTPYASAQQVVEVLSDVPELWDPGRGDDLLTLLRQWDEQPARHDDLTELLRAHLRSLNETDVPPLT
jgi:hypothetical protein